MSIIKNYLLAAFVLLVAGPAMVMAQAVVAHVIVGNCQGWSAQQWKTDMALAQSASIDGFVLNVATPYSSIQSSVANAFTAAQSLGFKLFFSFDYLGGSGPWSSNDVTSILNTYAGNSAHLKLNNKAVVSTFEGTNNIGDWAGIRSSVSGGITFIPDWTSLGPDGFKNYLSTVDGAYSWDMWPNGANDIADTNDLAWQKAIGTDKSYMMGVSPWFYTDLPQWQKQYTWRGDDMWHQRWQQVLDVKPAIVQIVTWNDYGESHYIGPIYEEGIPTNGNRYVDNMPHDAWRETLPYYISAYKNGGKATVSTEKLQYWYRVTPKAAGSTGGVMGNAPYQTQVDPNTIVQDKVFVTGLVGSLPATIVVQIGGSEAGRYDCTTVGANHFSVDFGGKTGDVTVSLVRNNQAVVTGKGTPILASPSDGTTNYNAWVGSASGSGSAVSSLAARSTIGTSTVPSSTSKPASSTSKPTSSAAASLTSSVRAMSSSKAVSSAVPSTLVTRVSSSSTIVKVAAVTSSAKPSILTVTSTIIATASSTKMSSAIPTATGNIKCPAANGSYFIDASTGKKFQVECGVDHDDGDLAYKSVSSFQKCIAACAAKSGCIDVSYDDGDCYMKKTIGASFKDSSVWGAKLVTTSAKAKRGSLWN